MKVFFFTTSIYNFFLFQRRRTNASNVLLNGLSYLLIHKVGCYFYFFFQVLSKKFLFAWKFLLKGLIFCQKCSLFSYKGKLRTFSAYLVHYEVDIITKLTSSFPVPRLMTIAQKVILNWLASFSFVEFTFSYSHLSFFVFDRITAAFSCNFRVTFCITKRK